jgi:hypothetical protein
VTTWPSAALRARRCARFEKNPHRTRTIRGQKRLREGRGREGGRSELSSAPRVIRTPDLLIRRSQHAVTTGSHWSATNRIRSVSGTDDCQCRPVRTNAAVSGQSAGRRNPAADLLIAGWTLAPALAENRPRDVAYSRPAAIASDMDRRDGADRARTRRPHRGPPARSGDGG